MVNIYLECAQRAPLIVWNLKVNQEKISPETIKREKMERSWRPGEKRGNSLLGDSKDMVKNKA
jgi:hypothetical protein